MPMLTLKILKSVNFTIAQKFRYLENETLFFAKNSFTAEVTFGPPQVYKNLSNVNSVVMKNF